ncbi:hypothetical protein QBC37DRAFT_429575 [Rhypophila decipiens]|uniref:Uncharacterized protein n=1 Tax=Rhypophila decipiens TaxID=261697 RepID=A0AAN6XZS7_9PEZI|nr:hypothetical protein QBC37DRAFT_429575 [Rhypophila decipiens]
MRVSSLFLLATSALALPEPAAQDSHVEIYPLPSKDLRPCGFKIAPCPYGTVCRAEDPKCPPVRGENCAGFCVPDTKPPIRFTTSTTTTTTTTSTKTKKPKPTKTKPTPTPTYQSCGGFRVEQVPCPKGQICVDDPRIEGCGMACDRPGICVTPEFCGGFAGFACKDANKLCVDDPRDDCDPFNGGADCGGICV